MRKNRAIVLLFATAVALASAATPPARTAQARLERVPALPSNSEAAYAQWIDSAGVLKPGPAFESLRDDIKSQLLQLARPSTSGAAEGRLSARDQALVSQIAPFSDPAKVLQGVQAVRKTQAALVQKWQADLHELEQHRLRERGALPACHNESGAPSQLAIRDVELSYAQQRAQIAARYLSEFQPVLQQLLTAVSPRIQHGDLAMDAWNRLSSSAARSRLGPVAHTAESEALKDVGVVEDFVQDISKLAARPIAERNALGRVYAQARGC